MSGSFAGKKQAKAPWKKYGIENKAEQDNAFNKGALGKCRLFA